MKETTDPRERAVSIYQGDDGVADDFPVLKAFQQYIDAEQAKARKRLIGLAIFFCVLMFTVVAVFVALLVTISQRNQTLNDRLVDYAMKERDRPAPVVVQPPVQQDNAAIVTLTAKIEDMQRKLSESQRRAEEAEKARQAALAPKVKTPQELELERLTALIAAQAEQNKQMLKAAEEKAKAEAAQARAEEARLKAEREAKAKAEEAKAEKARQREAELEAYRRKHYPELYEQPKPLPTPKRKVIESDVSDQAAKEAKEKDDAAFEKFLSDVDSVLNDRKARTYFSEEEEPEDQPLKTPSPKAQPPSPKAQPPSPKAQPPSPKVESTLVTTNSIPEKAKTAPKAPLPSWRIP